MSEPMIGIVQQVEHVGVYEVDGRTLRTVRLQLLVTLEGDEEFNAFSVLTCWSGKSRLAVAPPPGKIIAENLSDAIVNRAEDAVGLSRKLSREFATTAETIESALLYFRKGAADEAARKGGSK